MRSFVGSTALYWRYSMAEVWLSFHQGPRDGGGYVSSYPLTFDPRDEAEWAVTTRACSRRSRATRCSLHMEWAGT